MTYPQPITMVEGQPELWVQLAPYGRYPAQTDRGEAIVQICDKRAFDQLAQAFNGEVLLDAEHHSLDPSGDTSAYGWIKALRVDPQDGLLCHVRLTDLGEADVINRRRRYLSPVWTLDADGRPNRLVSVALTNTPNIRMRPIVNKTASPSMTPSPATAAGQNTTTATAGRNNNMDTKTLALALGLPETATADEILAAIKAAGEKAALAAQLEKRVAELEQAALAAEAEQVAAMNKAKIADTEKFKAIYCANKQLALDLLATIATPQTTVTNRSAAKPPPADSLHAATNKLAAYKAMPSGPEKAAFLAANKGELLRLEAQESVHQQGK